METKYTQGPWRVSEGNRQALEVWPQDQRYSKVCKLFSFNSDKKGNAQLIAAAPELLAILKELSEHAAHYKAVPASADLLWARVKAAIVKAEGGN